MKKSTLMLSVITFFCVALLASGSAFAEFWPTSVGGTWTVNVNNSTGVLSITQFSGATGSLCKPIRGTMLNDTIEGFYCPGGGRISFVRYDGNTTVAKQHFSGYLSQAFTGPLKIGGSFATFVHNNVAGTLGGSLGEYHFEATK
jgi:hypothetical protein